jgi:hypothetical protein
MFVVGCWIWSAEAALQGEALVKQHGMVQQHGMVSVRPLLWSGGFAEW